MSPRRSRMTSPGTSSRAADVIHSPSRLTRALIASSAFRAAIALPAWCSSQNPIVALATSRNRMMKKSGQCRSTADRITATSIIHGIGPQKYARNCRNGRVFFSSSSFGPYRSSRVRASASVRPSAEDANRSSTCARGSDVRSSSRWASTDCGFDSDDARSFALMRGSPVSRPGSPARPGRGRRCAAHARRAFRASVGSGGSPRRPDTVVGRAGPPPSGRRVW